MKRVRLSAILIALGLLPVPAVALDQTARIERQSAPQAIDQILLRLTKGSVAITGGSGQLLGQRLHGDAAAKAISEHEIIGVLQTSKLTVEQAAALWSFFAEQDNAALATLPIVKALISASDTPKSREAMWSELAGLSRFFLQGSRWRLRDPSLLGLFERHRAVLRPLLVELRETEPSTYAMIELMQNSRIFGGDLYESVLAVSERIPAAVARHIEQERGLGHPKYWQYTAFKSMVRWKNARFLPGAPAAPRSLAAFDAAAEQLITMFNCLQGLDPRFRDEILRGLSPDVIFNAIVAGEAELYRVGTSGYRDTLHKIVMSGIVQAGSFEAFVKQSALRRFGDEAAASARSRGVAFLRVASYFGLLDPVLETVRDRERFIAEAVASLDEPLAFEANSAVIMDILTTTESAPTALAFKRAMLDHLYDRYHSEKSAALKNAYGSMLSVYQTVTGHRRDSAIDHEFALDRAAFDIPFERLFSVDGKGGYVHRMFMRMHNDDDGYSTYQAFNVLMASLNASVREHDHFDVFTFALQDRTIEIYANKPSAAGLRQGIPNIEAALRGRRVETVIGRGHTAIIAQLQADSKRVLGDRISDVSVVVVGACGGDASVRDLIATFGYRPFFTTKSTGRQIINNAIIKTYIAALAAIPPGERLAIHSVLHDATGRFTRPGVDADLRSDAKLYQVNMATVFTAYLYDTRISRVPHPDLHAAHD